MRSQMPRLAVATLLVCFVLVSSSSAWARPVVSEPASMPAQESTQAKGLLDWVVSLIERHVVPHQSAAPEPPRNQPKEGAQMDPNGHH
jgi:hypothetical protein